MDNLSYSYDYSNDTEHFDNDSLFPVEGHSSPAVGVVSMVVYALTSFLGIPGNAFVIWISGIKMKRTVNTLWFLNLAIADFLCCLSLPFSIANIALDYHWPYGGVLCKVIPSAIILNMFASVFILTLISLDRFALVIKPVWAQNHRTISLAYLLCAAVWIMAVLLSLPSLIHREVQDSLEDHINICRYEVDGHIEAVIHITRFVFGFLLPCLVITLCYAMIVRKVSSRFAKSRKTLKIILGVIVAFFVCWLPYHVNGILLSYAPLGSAWSDMAETLDPLVICLAYINSCLNPILYVFMGQDFKEKVRKSLRHIVESAFSEEQTRSTVHSRGKSSMEGNSSEAQL
ncbi:C3a anaphylatoxin chemotactic receptor [Amia ocellicauda]|uniref:C3a anaphylatoxin chemotactic receptor n=1 Tax=Amia ocellicauda TaxID=2972642 RepID=UPI0034649DFD